MPWMKVAGLTGALAVIAGAFGAHWLNGRIPASALDAYRVGAQYHLLHAVALLGVAAYAEATGRRVTRPATLLLAGIVLFSGSLYALSMTGARAFGAVTPIGGLLLILGWGDIAFGLTRSATHLDDPR